jgi:hypothetical protein
MSQRTKNILRRVDAWPAEDQEELAEVAQEIEARRAGIYRLSSEEREAVKRGVVEMRAGGFAEESDVAATLQKARAAPR